MYRPGLTIRQTKYVLREPSDLGHHKKIEYGVIREGTFLNCSVIVVQSIFDN